MDNPSDQFFLALDRGSNGRIKLPIDMVQVLFLRTFPHWQGSLDRRERLRAMIDELAIAARVRLPKNTRSGWQRAPSPALPKWLCLSRKSAKKESSPFDHRSFPWVSELGFIPALQHFRDANDALQIHLFLKNGGSKRPIVPVKERSFELFGDEKRLDALKSSQLFSLGRLTFDMLRCRNVPATLSCVPSPREATQPWLIVENEATFHSFCRLNAQRYIHAGVILGSGIAVLRATEFLASLLSISGGKRLMYFGDVDAEGVHIPVQLHRDLKRSHNISIVPAEQYYTWMLAKHQTNGGQPASESPVLQWFPINLRLRVAAILRRQGHIAQEMIGWEWLCREFNVDPSLQF